MNAEPEYSIDEIESIPAFSVGEIVLFVMDEFGYGVSYGEEYGVT